MKSRLYALSKYDMTQKIFETLSDVQCRTILFSMIKEGKTAIDIVEKHHLPLSSVYKKITKLEDLGLIQVTMVKVSERGRKFNVYKSRIRGFDMSVNDIEPTINLLPNTRMQD